MMRLPLRLDVDLFTVFDADDHVVMRAERSKEPDPTKSEREDARVARDLAELVIARNFTRYLSPPSMEGRGALSIEDGLRLSIVPDTHFRPGPLGLVPNPGDDVSEGDHA